LRHGLAAISRHSATLWPEIERNAKALCNGDSNPLLFEQAVIIAENEIVLRGVRLEKVARIERLRDPTAKPLSKKGDSLARAKVRFRLLKLRYKRLLQAKPNSTATPSGQGQNLSPGRGSQLNQAQLRRTQAIKPRDEFDALRRALPDLNRLARYKRRAWSRQRRAIRQFMEIASDR
jgi:hypothetical protein